MLFRFAGFELDHQRAELRGPGGETIRLRPKTFDLLRQFTADPERIHTKQELMEAVWPNVHVGEDSLFQCIREIRTALGDEDRQIVKLVSGRGYLFNAEVTAERSAAEISQAETETPVDPSPAAKPGWKLFGLRAPIAFAAVAAIGAVFGLAIAAPIFGPELLRTKTPALAIMPITATGADADEMAVAVTNRLTDGLAKIDNFRVVAPDVPSASPQAVSAPAAAADFVLSGELEKTDRTWELRARITKTATREVVWTAPVSVAIAGDRPPLSGPIGMLV